jgi:hypothetical protein
MSKPCFHTGFLPHGAAVHNWHGVREDSSSACLLFRAGSWRACSQPRHQRVLPRGHPSGRPLRLANGSRVAAASARPWPGGVAQLPTLRWPRIHSRVFGGLRLVSHRPAPTVPSPPRGFLPHAPRRAPSLVNPFDPRPSRPPRPSPPDPSACAGPPPEAAPRRAARIPQPYRCRAPPAPNGLTTGQMI